VIDPAADENSVARLFFKIDNKEVPVCQLSSVCTNAEISIRIFPTRDICFRVAGNTAIHISGYYPPTPENTNPQLDAFDLGGSI
jgi:hypothetical protein